MGLLEALGPGQGQEMGKRKLKFWASSTKVVHILGRLRVHASARARLRYKIKPAERRRSLSPIPESSSLNSQTLPIFLKLTQPPNQISQGVIPSSASLTRWVAERSSRVSRAYGFRILGLRVMQPSQLCCETSGGAYTSL